MTATDREKTAAALLDLLATVACGELVSKLADPTLRELYAKCMSRAVELRDTARAESGAR